jgi:iron complex outermembrane receptor protein
MTVKNVPLLMGALLAAALGAAHDAQAVSEHDFLGDMPIVLSVSRLAQRLDETPGAVTIFDRQFIRMSGARDVTDLLRMVPGFQTTNSYETDAPMASYHGRSDDFSSRLQVLVDGRAVYSGYLFGSTGIGLQSLALDDVERIEVLRGSNSAAYGARAFLGVVNIISRDVRETGGMRASVTGGENAIADTSARIGWGEPDAMYRISVDRVSDGGLKGAFGTNRTSRVNFSSRWRTSSDTEVDLRLGAVNIDAGRGSTDSGEYGNAARVRYLGSRFVQANASRSLDPDTDLMVSMSRTEMTNRDRFPFLNPDPGFAPYYGISIDFSGDETIDVLGVQYTKRLSSNLRTVAGVEYQSELVVSPSGFDQRERVATRFTRVFGNAEWRVVPTLIVNAGFMADHNDMTGDSVSPRLMLNWHASDNHALRAGVSTAFRPPSAYEKYALVRYYDTNGQNPTPAYVQARGNVGAERVNVDELGYNATWPAANVTGDVRVFRERVTDGVWCDPDAPTDCTNKDNFTIEGAEYQVTWKPAPSTHVFFNQNWTRISGLTYTLGNSPLDKHRFRVTHGAPEHSSAVSVMHTFASGLNVSVLYNMFHNSALMSNPESGQLYSMSRWDLRVAKPLRFGPQKAEVALTVHNLGDPYLDGSVGYHFERRAMVTLRLEN